MIVAILTVFTLLAFAANSLICRMALGGNMIDPLSFTTVRLFSGALVLIPVSRFFSEPEAPNAAGSWKSALALFTYAMAFSLAYVSLNTGVGALLLFGAVQITMILLSILSGNRLHITEWLGVAIAFAGFVYLVLPGLSTPSLAGFVLMTVAGIAWGVYTLRGRASTSPLADTCYNFLRTVPVVLVLALVTVRNAHYSVDGIVLSVLSGAVASGMGYTIWYIALGGLTATQAAVVQLSVPVIAALGGVVFVSEAITLRLVMSASMILGGIAIVIWGRNYVAKPESKP